ncbi:uncharacterized protein LOC130621195 [Hydractinia symbiolongicarpus]|uniref:uncharacterized protein LOC130621195 n=1 Tax=Hydractinia symbiolongicarpus TaxID=13093 RepID=UPI0025500C68|nr:uncharacterized protein LOC130621195 [Hydractinia symbiolongicarpus]
MEDYQDEKLLSSESALEGNDNMNWGKMHLQNLVSVLSSKEIDPVEVTAITMSLVFGSFVIVLPYTVNLVGLPIWIITFIVVLLLVSYSNHLMNESCLKMLDACKNEKLIRAPYVKVALLAGGNLFKNVVVGTLYMNFAFSVISQMLMSSTVLSEILSISGISKINNVRFWVVISSVSIFPFVQLGFYKDLKQSAFIALAMSYLSLLFILGASAYLLLTDQMLATPDNKYVKKQYDNFFRTFGTVFFSLAGIALVSPEITVFAREPKKMDRSILATYGMIAFINLGYCIIMHEIFQGNMKSTTTDTLLQAFLLTDATLLKGCLVAVQIGVSLHFLLAAVLFLNPLLTNVEARLDIPVEFTWKRLVLRTFGLLATTIVCLIVPNFQSILSLCGGTLLVLSTVIYPNIIYSRLHESKSPPPNFSVDRIIRVETEHKNFVTRYKALLKLEKGTGKDSSTQQMFELNEVPLKSNLV